MAEAAPGPWRHHARSTRASPAGFCSCKTARGEGNKRRSTTRRLRGGRRWPAAPQRRRPRQRRARPWPSELHLCPRGPGLDPVLGPASRFESGAIRRPAGKRCAVSTRGFSKGSSQHPLQHASLRSGWQAAPARGPKFHSLDRCLRRVPVTVLRR